MDQGQPGDDPGRSRQADDGAPDEVVLAQVAMGDAEALAVLYARHQRALRSYLALFTADRGLAEALMQDTLVAAWTGAKSFGGRASVRSWLLGLARRRASAALGRRPWHVVSVDGLGSDEVPPEPDPADLALTAVVRRELAAAIGDVAPVYRDIVMLIFVHGLTYREVAETLAIPVGTVQRRLHAARLALRALLEPDASESTRSGHDCFNSTEHVRQDVIDIGDNERFASLRRW
jgi:RNA polymerase sigma factor (sigma-70 family)